MIMGINSSDSTNHWLCSNGAYVGLASPRDVGSWQRQCKIQIGEDSNHKNRTKLYDTSSLHVSLRNNSYDASNKVVSISTTRLKLGIPMQVKINKNRSSKKEALQAYTCIRLVKWLKGKRPCIDARAEKTICKLGLENWTFVEANKFSRIGTYIADAKRLE
ncbi:hypothetical protein Fmac_017657 [Flemingia macrophylla]|uniref:LAGLIDADG homing endonuclease n=1 Tax=Flemingia macrophylla TaxID=520843 RepID=A0ABD1M2X6_9FABA